MAAFNVLVRGARGSVPVSGERFRRYGGASTCYEIELGPERRLFVDAGTGVLSVHEELSSNGSQHFTILLTHLHWDHTLGLPFLAPLRDATNHFDFYGHQAGGLDIEEAIDAVMRPPYFPVNFRSLPAVRRFHHVDGTPFMVEDIKVRPVRLHHPDGVTAYRLEREGRSLVVATDVEPGEPLSDAALGELAAGADVLIYDAQYLPEEYTSGRIGWGHSTWETAVSLAEKASVGRLILTSHDPGRSDDQIDSILALARSRFPNTDAAYEGMRFQVD
jgi:phosphoribosyl 1,2-cyclic phosphodiesterase